MDIPAGLLPDSYLWSAAAIYVLLLCLALVTAPWSKIVGNEASHVYFGAIFMLILLWLLRGGIQPGLDYHLLGVTLLCLMFEWQFSLTIGDNFLLIFPMLKKSNYSMTQPPEFIGCKGNTFSGCNVSLGLQFQPVDATHWLNRSAGVSKSNVCRGRSLSCLATALSLF